MKRFLFLIVVLFHFASTFAQSNYVICKVIESNNVISVTFGDGIKYLGDDYVKQLGLYNDKNELVYKTGFEIVTYLKEHWGWELCGNPVISKNYERYELKHKIDRVLPNLWKQIEKFKEYENKVNSKR